MELYIVRHGETDWNALDKIQGRTDNPLNEKGKAQAKAAAEKLKDVPIDVIISSPLIRAYETAEAIAEYHEGVTILKEPALLEMNYGSFEGKYRLSPEFIAAKRNGFANRYPEGGESYFDVAARVYPLIEKLKREYPDKTVLLTAHNGIMRVVDSYFHDLSVEEFIFFAAGNTDFRHYTL